MKRETAGIVKIECHGCGAAELAEEPLKPKELAKARGWKHAGTGKWLCPACAAERE